MQKFAESFGSALLLNNDSIFNSLYMLYDAIIKEVTVLKTNAVNDASAKATAHRERINSAQLSKNALDAEVASINTAIEAQKLNLESHKTALQSLEAQRKITKEALQKACECRVYEGIFINKSVEDMREDIIASIQDLNVVPPYLRKCSSHQCNPMLNNCFKPPSNKHKKQRSTYGEIMTYIRSKEPAAKPTVICIFCVVNISRSKNDPPVLQYIDLRDIKLETLRLSQLQQHGDLFELANLSHDMNVNANGAESQEYEDNIKDLLASNNNLSLDSKVDPNVVGRFREWLDFYQKSVTPTDLSNLKSYISQTANDEHALYYLQKIIQLVDKINSVTLLGTLEFTDAIAKYDLVNIPCAHIKGSSYNMEVEAKGARYFNRGDKMYSSAGGGAATADPVATLPQTQVDKSKSTLKKLGELSGKWKDVKYEFDAAVKMFETFLEFSGSLKPSSFETFAAGSSYGPEWIAKLSKIEETMVAFLKSAKTDLIGLLDGDAELDPMKKAEFMGDLNKVYDGNNGEKDKVLPIIQQYKSYFSNVTSTYNTIKATLQTLYQKLKTERNVALEKAKARPVQGLYRGGDDPKESDIIVGDDRTKLEDTVSKARTANNANAIATANGELDNVIANIERVYRMQSSPALMSTMGDNLFAKMLNEYLTDKGTNSTAEFKARDKLVTTLEANQLIPAEVLKVNRMDRVVFIFTTLFIRLFCLSLVEFLIERGSIKTVTAATFAFLGLYTAVFVAFALMVNIDLYRLRIVFNMLNMHANSGHVYLHLGLLWLIGFFMYTILTNINVFNFGVKVTAINDYEKQQLMSKLQLLTLIVWCILTLVIILA